MKKYLWLPLILMAVIGSAALTTKAQSSYGVRANVPFDFNVGDKTLPAGKITAREMSASSGALAISNLDKRQHAIRIAHGVSSSNQNGPAKLVFRKYGNRYYLTQVWIPGYNGMEFQKSKTERALERETMLSKNSTTELVTIMADLQ
jgi:hypothetical protein